MNDTERLNKIVSVFMGTESGHWTDREDLFFHLIRRAKQKSGWGLHELRSCSPYDSHSTIMLCNDFAYVTGSGATPMIALCEAIAKIVNGNSSMVIQE